MGRWVVGSGKSFVRQFIYPIALLVGALATQGASLFADASLPLIHSHSETTIAVYKGDTLTLQASVEGAQQVKWVVANQVVCREATCKFSTENWEIGRYRFVFIALNEAGSSTVIYRLRILAPPPEHQPTEVVPQIKNLEQEIETLSQDDVYVGSMRGRGFSYRRNKLDMVGEVPRRLDGKEKLRTQAGAIIKLGKMGSDEHFLLPETNVFYSLDDEGRRNLKFQKGTLRSRNLAPKTPYWQIHLEEKFTLVSDEKGDVIVERIENKDKLPDTVRLTVLRGRVNLRSYSPSKVVVKDDNEDAGPSDGKKSDEKSAGKKPEVETGIMIPAGVQVEINLKEKFPAAIAYSVPNSKRVTLVMFLTTPQYFGQKNAEQAFIKRESLSTPSATDIESNKGAADDALNAQDPMLALDALQNSQEKLKQDFVGCLLLGRAYYGVNAHQLAAEWLKRAIALDDSRPEPDYLLGVMSLQNGKWQKAQEWLDSALAKEDEPSSMTQYYSGVALYRGAKYLTARSRFTEVVWSRQDNPRISSAQKFLQALEYSRWWRSRLFGGFGYDTNIFHTSDASTIPESVGSNSGMFARGGMNLEWLPFNSKSGHLSFGFYIARNQFVSSALKDVSYLDQVISLDLGILLGGSAEAEPAFSMGLKPYIEMEFIGGERSLDSFSLDFNAGSPRWANTSFIYGTRRSLDPMPERDDALDVVLWEHPTQVTDRSNDLVMMGIQTIPTWGSGNSLTLRLTNQSVTYDGDDAVADSHSGMGLLMLYGGAAESLRSNYRAGFSYTTRTFSESTDGRKDTKLAPTFGWQYRLTPLFDQDIGFTYESQSSGRSASKYTRMLFLYQLGLTL